MRTVTFDLAGGTRTGGGQLTQTVANGGSAIAPEVSRSGFIFDGWDRAFTNVTANITVTALWRTAGGGGGIWFPPSSQVPVISVATQPAATTTVTQGSITGTLSAAATATQNAAVTYQWFSNTTASNTGGTAITGATGATFTIPATLTTGTYYYFVEVRAGSAQAVRSSVATVTVNAQFPARAVTATPAGYTNPFTDVAVAEWYYSAIAFANHNGLMQGKPDNLFDPDTAMTRAEVATVLYRLVREPALAANAPVFADTGADTWYVNPVRWAAANDVITGTAAGFNPEGEITRADLAVAMYRICELAGISLTGVRVYDNRFGDIANLSQGQRTAVIALFEAGIIEGISATEFGTAAGNRAQLATILHRILVPSVRLR
jgi:hypothetical protein